MDALADILKTIRLTTSTYFCSDFNTAWGMEISQADKGLFHVMVAGQCWLKAANQETAIHLQQGDIVAFPTGGAHWLSDAADSPRQPSASVLEKILSGDNPFHQSGAQPSNNTLMCGAFEYDSAIDHPFLKDLPCFIHISAQQTPELDWLRELVQVLAGESKQAGPGSSVVIDRLTEVLFIQLLRVYMQQNKQSAGYLSALDDSKIGSALNLIHHEENAALTVEILANKVALSRSAFSEKFSKLVGQSAKSYLLNWRMQKAKSLLQENKISMYAVAQCAGYSSEAAFSKAFKQRFNIAPGGYRKEHKAQTL